jgi:hypothetical protein
VASKLCTAAARFIVSYRSRNVWLWLGGKSLLNTGRELIVWNVRVEPRRSVGLVREVAADTCELRLDWNAAVSDMGGRMGG